MTEGSSTSEAEGTFLDTGGDEILRLPGVHVADCEASLEGEAPKDISSLTKGSAEFAGG